MAVIMSKEFVVPSAPIRGTLASDIEVGGSVFLRINGSLKEFLVVHQGLPSSVYDASCDGTWLLMKDIYAKMAWDSSDNDYANSDIHAYLNGDFLALMDSDIQSAIQQVKLPYTNGTGTGGSLATGSNGISAQVFLLSYTEVGFSGSSYAKVEGAVVDYFNGAANSDRIAYYNGTATSWWLRSPYTSGTDNVMGIYSGGNNRYDFVGVANQVGIRPALILPSNALFDPDTGEFLGIGGVIVRVVVVIIR